MADRAEHEDALASPTRLARAGGISFAGSVVGAALGFALTLVLARSFGSTGAGIVLQATGIFVIGLAVGRGGLDTATTWMVPRLVASEHRELGATIRHILVLSLVSGVGAAVLTWVVARLVFDQEVHQAVAASVWALPLASVTLVGTAALRAFGEIRSYILLVQIVVPALRVAFILAVAAVGFGAVAGSFAWALPYVLGGPLAVLLVMRKLSRKYRTSLRGATRRDTRSEIERYRYGRLAAGILEQGLLWVDVLLVGFLVGTTAAGVYGSVARFVFAALIVDAALRFVLAPIFSSLLFESRYDEAQALFVRSTAWLVLLSVPLCLGLAIYAPLVLTWLGPDFADGERAMQILCLGTALTLTAGNVHTMLLMAGRSGQAAMNKLLVLSTNVGLNLLLVPVWGIEAAASVWVLSMLLDAGLAGWQVHRATGVRAAPLGIGYAVLVTLLTVGLPAVLLRLWLGPTLVSLLAAVVSGAVLLGTWVYLDRRRLHVKELVDPIRARLAR